MPLPHSMVWRWPWTRCPRRRWAIMHMLPAGRAWGLPLAYATSALLFSLVHVGGATEGLLALLVPLFMIGLLLAWALHATRSLLPCIIAHAINNGVALVALITCVNLPGTAGCPPL